MTDAVSTHPALPITPVGETAGVPGRPGAAPAALLACAAAAAIGGAALPVWRVGIGWPLSALAVGAAGMVARAARPAGGGLHGGDRAWRAAAAISALALLTVPALRAAGWLDAMCVVAGIALASYALVGGATFGEVLGAAGALLRAAGVATASLVTARRISGRRGGGSLPLRVFGGLTVGVVLVIIFGALFAAADPRFASLLASWRDDLEPAEAARILVGAVLVGGAALGVTLLATRQRTARAAVGRTPGGLGRAEWLIPVAMLDVLFGVFVGVELPTLFGGDAVVLAPGGPDYAVYARGGFTELMVATALTLAVVAALARFVGRDRPADRRVLRLAGGVLCLLALVVVVSALKRLGLYAQAYGFTRTRLLGYVGEVWLGAILVLMLVAGIRLRGVWLPRATVAAGVALLLGLAAINPDALMARSHLARLDHDYPIDTAFLGSLSTDAIDVVWPVWGGQCQQPGPDPWYAWNASRAHARTVTRLGCLVEK